MATVGLLRVKDEARWIRQVLRAMQPVCDRMVVFDDHSADSTADIAADEGATVIASPFDGLAEARDKDYLLAQAKLEPGDVVCAFDGDEMLHQDDVQALKNDIASGAPALSLRIVYLWDREDRIRTDGVYGRFRRPSVFRYRQGLSFLRTGNGGEFHCGNVPYALHDACRNSEARLLHYGYMHRQDRLRKFRWYNEQDPHNRAEDQYRHMVIGDIFPAHSRFRHAGPLEVRALC